MWGKGPVFHNSIERKKTIIMFRKQRIYKGGWLQIFQLFNGVSGYKNGTCGMTAEPLRRKSNPCIILSSAMNKGLIVKIM